MAEVACEIATVGSQPSATTTSYMHVRRTYRSALN